MRVLLISTYDLGRQPFGLASPAAWLRAAGFETECLDLAVEAFDEARVARADLVAFHLPMHTATRLAVRAVPRVRAINPRARLGFYGLYAGMNAAGLRALGAEFVLGGEFEAGLTAWARSASGGPPVEPPTGDEGAPVSLERLEFRVPDRSGLPPLEQYARIAIGAEERVCGTTESTRGCKHLCRHCPVVPVYGGRFRAIPREVVLADVAQQVAAGARHVSFGDPDFWNGIGHALPLVRELHERHPDLTYDVTIKIEHLLRHAGHLATLRATGCVLVTSAVEAVDDAILARLDKGHTRADFERVVGLCREAGLALQPTFVAFTPWITVAGYQDLLHSIASLGLIEHVAPVQLAIRLLIPAGSRTLELPDIARLVGPFDPAALVHPWRHPDPAVDELQRDVDGAIQRGLATGASRAAIFAEVWRVAARAPGATSRPLPANALVAPAKPVPTLSEPWYCCAEPLEEQAAAI